MRQNPKLHSCQHQSQSVPAAGGGGGGGVVVVVAMLARRSASVTFQCQTDLNCCMPWCVYVSLSALLLREVEAVKDAVTEGLVDLLPEGR